MVGGVGSLVYSPSSFSTSAFVLSAQAMAIVHGSGRRSSRHDGPEACESDPFSFRTEAQSVPSDAACAHGTGPSHRLRKLVSHVGRRFVGPKLPAG